MGSHTSSEVSGTVILNKPLTALCFGFLTDKLQTVSLYRTRRL